MRALTASDGRPLGFVDESVYTEMMGTTTIRVSTATRDGLRQVARSRSMTVAQATAHGLTLLLQEQIGRDLAAPLTDDEIDWLDADAG